MNVDILLTQPTHVDFPLFREWLHNNRSLFNNVIVSFSRSGGYDLSNEIRNVMLSDNILFLDNYSVRSDWRDAAVHAGLEHSIAPYVLFLEQDFIIKNPKFTSLLTNPPNEVIGFQEGGSGRLHPAFLLVSRQLLNQTCLNFSACPVPPEPDHFGYISMNLKRLHPGWVTLEKLGLNTPNDWEHIAGLTHNYTLLQKGEYVAFFRQRFIRYNKECLEVSIPQTSFINTIIESSSLI